MQLWRAEWCIWMFMCVCVWICQVFKKKDGRRVKRVRVINAWWSHEVFTSLNYLHTFLLFPCRLNVFLLPFSLTILRMYPHTLLKSIVHIFPYFSPHLHTHITHCEVLSVGSYLPFFSEFLLIKKNIPRWFFMVMEALTEDYQTQTYAFARTHTHKTPATFCFSLPLHKTHTHTHTHGVH